MPALAVKDTFTVASQAAMLALTAQRGDMAIRTDNGRTYVLAGDNASAIGDWRELTAYAPAATPTAWNDITGKPAVIAAGADQAAARTAIGAGTSNLALGTTSTTAKAGDWRESLATTSEAGRVELATDAETTRTSTDATRVPTLASLAKVLADRPTVAGLPVRLTVDWYSWEDPDPTTAGPVPDWVHYRLHLVDNEPVPSWAASREGTEILRVDGTPTPTFVFSWEGTGIADGTAFTGQAGTDDDAWSGTQGTGLTVRTGDTKSPAFEAAAAGAMSYVYADLGVSTTRQLRAYFKTPATLVSTAILDLCEAATSNPTCRIAIGSNGQFRLMNSAHTHVAQTSSSFLSADTWYRIELSLDQDAADAANSVARLRIYNLAGTALWDSTDITDAVGFGTSHQYLRAGTIGAVTASTRIASVRVTNSAGTLIGA